MAKKAYDFTSRSQRRLIQDILADIDALGDAEVRGIVQGSQMVGVSAMRMGLCSRVMHRAKYFHEYIDFLNKSVRELVLFLLNPPSDCWDATSLGMAAVNSLLPVPEDAFPLKAQYLIQHKGKGRNVCVIGHFPFLEKMNGQFSNLWVFELHPRGSDLPAEAAPYFLPRADVLAITATTLLNGTCAKLLRYTRKDAFTIMLGPSTPFAPSLFEWGIDVLAGCKVTNPSLATSRIEQGYPFKHLEGVDSLVWINPENAALRAQIDNYRSQ
ncbi:MAG: DUF364 domain-containing protein [Deltaproteobacteria bacterium]|nr:DUF364 domain-containing protein [Deltaproteobacteria bacterium]